MINYPTESEINSMYDDKTWTFLPLNCINTIGFTWKKKKLLQPNKEPVKNKGYSNIVPWTKHRHFLSLSIRIFTQEIQTGKQKQKHLIKIVPGKIWNYDQFLFLTNQNVWKWNITMGAGGRLLGKN